MSQFEIYAVRYAGPVTSSGAFVRWLSDWDLSTERGYYFWVIKSPEVTALVDCGSRPVQAAGGRLPNYVSPPEMLLRLGLSAERIGHVILTHLHWDHAGAAEMFPRARFHVHKREFDFWQSDPVAQKGPFRLLSDRPCLDYLARARVEGRLDLVEEDGPFLPGISGLLAPGHSPGLMAVAVDTAKGRAVLGSDCGHFFANYRDEWPTSLICDLPAWLRSFEKLKKQAADGLLFPGHDLLMSGNYPLTAPGITRLA